MKLLRNFYFVLIALFGIQSLAFAATEQESINQLSKLLDQAQSMTGKFSQLTLDATGTRLQETNGDLALKRPGLFRWHTSAPQEQLLISDNQKIWLYDPDLEQMTVQKMDKRMSHTPALLLSGKVSDIQKSFKISSKQVGATISFTLIPKAKDSLFNSLTLSFVEKTIKGMQLTDNVGQKTNIVFKDIKMNTPVDSQLFKFTPPAGTDIIEE